MATLDELTTDQSIETLRKTAPDILLVGLGCPKQEVWMHRVNTRLGGIQIGLGGAFEFYGGVRKRSPDWVHRFSLEWLYRLASEPRRLFARYFINNPRFIALWLTTFVRRFDKRPLLRN